MAPRAAFAVMAILLAEPCISPGTAFQAGCQLQKTRVPLTDAITCQPSVMPVIGIGVIEALSHSCCLWIGMDVAQCMQHSPVIFWSNGSGVIPGFPKMPATSRKAIQSHGRIPANPMHQLWQFICIIRTQKQMQVISHQTNRIQLVWHLLLGFIQHC